MAVSVNEVEKLNEKIESLNTTRTKTETRREMLTQSLEKELKEYESLYGINLRGSKFSQTYANIQEEAKRVSEEIKKEYDLKVKVVSAIESGDITEANRLLGVEEEVEIEDATEENQESEEEESVVQEGEDFGDVGSDIPEGMSPIEEAMQGIEEDDSIGGLSIDKDDFLNDEDEDDEEVEGFSMEDFMGGKFMA